MFDNMMKYIMVNKNRPVLFLDTWDHNKVAAAICGPKDKVTSAGFVRIINNKARCYGRSVTLKLQHHEDDSQIVSRALGLEED